MRSECFIYNILSHPGTGQTSSISCTIFSLQKTDLEVKIAREEIQAQILTREKVKFWLSDMIDLNPSSQDNQQHIIDTLQIRFGSRKANQDKYKG